MNCKFWSEPFFVTLRNSNAFFSREYDGTVSQKEKAKLSSYYLGSLKGPKRGRCVILNYEQFLNPQKRRTGTEFDVKALKKTFESLNFQVIIHHDMTHLGTESIIENGIICTFFKKLKLFTANLFIYKRIQT